MIELRIKLTKFQSEEVAYGLSVDADQAMLDEVSDYVPWGRLEGRTLVVTDVDDAVYRITSSRDILGDNDLMAAANSMDRLADKVIDAAGGRQVLKPETRQWL